MADIIDGELQAGKFVSDDPSDGALSVILAGGALGALVSWDDASGDVLHGAPAGSDLGGGTRRHLFDRELYVDSDGLGAYENVREWTSILNKPATFPPSAHSHTFAALQLADGAWPTTLAGYGITNGISTAGGETIAGALTLQGTLNSRDLVPTTSAAYDVGNTTFRYRDGWFTRNVVIGGTLGVTGVATFTTTTIHGAATDPVRIGRVSDSTTRGLVTWNSVETIAGMLGISGSVAVNFLLYNAPTSGGHEFRINGTTLVQLTTTGIAVEGSVKPLTDAASDLSDATHRFRDGYLSRNLTVGGNIVSSATILTAVSGMTNSVALSQLTDATTYGILTFNGTYTAAGLLGLAGGGGADKTLFFKVPTAGAFQFHVNNLSVANVSAAGLLTVVGVTAVGADSTFSNAVRISNSTGHLLAVTDNTFDIGASGANRFRDGYFSRNLSIGGAVTASGVVSVLSNNAGLVLQATSAATAVYHEYKNSGGTRRGFIGFGGATATSLEIYNAENGPLIFTSNLNEIGRWSSAGLFIGSTGAAASSPLHVLASSNTTLLTLNNSHVVTPYGIGMTFSGTAPNNTGQYFFRAADVGAERCVIYANGGIANFSANNVNLSDERVKIMGEPLDGRLAADLLAHLDDRRIVRRFKYADQTHDDWNIGLGVHEYAAALEERSEFAALIPSLIDKDGWGETDTLKLWSEYTTDRMNIVTAAVGNVASRLTSLEADVLALRQERGRT